MLCVNVYHVYKLQFSRAVLWSFNGAKIAGLLHISAKKTEIQGECLKSSELLRNKNRAQKTSQIPVSMVEF